MSAGDDLRKQIHDEYDIDGVTATALVEQLVHLADEIEMLEDAIAEHGAIVPGARNQLVASPALAALARHRTTFARLLAAAFPEPESKRTQNARNAAEARWRMTP